MLVGKLITFEGIDGSGKSTQIQLLEAEFEKMGITYQTFREPGGTGLSEKIREILLDKDNIELYSNAESLLFAAARAQLTVEQIKPAIAKGECVICDRFTDSTIAYQGYGRGLNLNSIESVVAHCIKPYDPDLTILLNISPETVPLRLEQREEYAEKDRLDLESLNFFKKTAQGFQVLAAAETERYVCLNGEQDIEVIHQEIVAVLQERFQLG